MLKNRQSGSGGRPLHEMHGDRHNNDDNADQCPWTRSALLRKLNFVKAKSEAWAAAVPSSPVNIKHRHHKHHCHHYDHY